MSLRWIDHSIIKKYLFISLTILLFEVYFPWNEYIHWNSDDFFFPCDFLFHHIMFNLSVALLLKGVSFGCHIIWSQFFIQCLWFLCRKIIDFTVLKSTNLLFICCLSSLICFLSFIDLFNYTVYNFIFISSIGLLVIIFVWNF